MRVRRTDLQTVLLDKARQLGIPVHFDKRIVAIEERDDGIELAFSDGTRDMAQLLLGCDGIHSSVRGLYVDPQTSPEYSGISVIYLFLPTSSLPPSTSTVTSLTGTYTRHGLFAVMPCSASFDTIFWFFSYEVPIPTSGNNREGWEEQGRREDDGFKAALLGFLGDIQMEWGGLPEGRDQENRNSEVLSYLPASSWRQMVSGTRPMPCSHILDRVSRWRSKMLSYSCGCLRLPRP